MKQQDNFFLKLKHGVSALFSINCHGQVTVHSQVTDCKRLQGALSTIKNKIPVLFCKVFHITGMAGAW
ncbi:MAG: hypothetical protein U9N77_11670, partial [Thermodesulfobacteriota bacterium]|nr:hypothetical protein [Thermodesulfobacteriota bacterium]